MEFFFFLTVVNVFGVITILEFIEIKLLFNCVHIVLEPDIKSYCRFPMIIDCFPLYHNNTYLLMMLKNSLSWVLNLQNMLEIL